MSEIETETKNMPVLERLRYRDHEGRLEWIGVRSVRRGAVHSLQECYAQAGLGLHGDHRSNRPPKPGSPSKRQVTLLQAEHLPVIAALTGHAHIDPALLRRNLLIAGINLLALKSARFWLGEVLLEGSGACHPCSRMEEALGSGGFQAMRGHGGITACIVQSGMLRQGDRLRLASEEVAE